MQSIKIKTGIVSEPLSKKQAMNLYPDKHSQHILSVDQVVRAIHASKGVFTQAAKLLGVSRHTLYLYRDKFPEVHEAVVEAGERAIDDAENAIHNMIQNPEHKDHFSSTKYLLACKGKKRGWNERAPQQVNIAAKDAVIEIVIGNDGGDEA